MTETDKECSNTERQTSLTETLERVDQALRAGQDIDHRTLRELCAQCKSDDELWKRLRQMNDDWPKWTRVYVIQGMKMSIARKNGVNCSYAALFIESNETPPIDSFMMPLQAWTVLYWWLSEGGSHSGVGLPAWVWNYLGDASYKMQKLRADMGTPTAERLKKIPAALGYSDDRRNVFSADWKDLEEEVATLIYDSAGGDGKTGDARIAPVADFFGIRDTRTARRYVAKGRKNTKPLPPWAK